MGVDVHGLVELIADLANAPVRVHRKAGVALSVVSHLIVAEAQANAPVDTGFHRSSISADVDTGALTAIIGPTSFYGGFLEHGTSRMAPRPHVVPAFDHHAPTFAQALAAIDPLAS